MQDEPDFDERWENWRPVQRITYVVVFTAIVAGWSWVVHHLIFHMARPY